MRALLRLGLLGLVGTLLCTRAAVAQVPLFAATVRGGVSTDGSGVSVAGTGTGWVLSPNPLEVRMPATATVRRAFLIVMGKWTGFNGDPATMARLNGLAVSVAGAPLATSIRMRAYDVTNGFGITRAGNYAWEEWPRRTRATSRGTGSRARSSWWCTTTRR